MCKQDVATHIKQNHKTCGVFELASNDVTISIYDQYYHLKKKICYCYTQSCSFTGNTGNIIVQLTITIHILQRLFDN